MAHQTLPVWIFLVLSGAESLILDQAIRYIEKPKSDYFHISSDYLGQDKFVFATMNKTGLSWKWVHVTLKDQKLYKNCTFWLNGNKNAESFGLDALMSLKGNQVLLAAHEQIKSGSRYTTVAYLDMDNCKIKYPLPFELSGKNIVQRRYDDRFDVFTADKEICQKKGDTCLVRYFGNYYQIEPFQVDLDWSSLRIKRTFKDNVYLMCGLNGAGQYQIELHDLTKETSIIHKELMSLPYDKDMQIETSNLAVCWIDTKRESNTVHCSQFNQKGGLIFNSVITYEKEVKLVLVHYLRPCKIVLLTGIDQKEGWRLLITIVECNQLSKFKDNYHNQIKVACNEPSHRVPVAFDVRNNIRNTIEIDYICYSPNHFTNHTIYVVDKL